MTVIYKSPTTVGPTETDLNFKQEILKLEG